MNNYDLIFNLKTRNDEEMTYEEHLELMNLARVIKVNIERAVKNVEVRQVIIAEALSHERF